MSHSTSLNKSPPQEGSLDQPEDAQELAHPSPSSSGTPLRRSHFTRDFLHSMSK